MTPTDALNLSAMTPATFLQTMRSPIAVPDAYLIVDVRQSTSSALWASNPGQNDWFSVPTSSVSTLRPCSFPDNMDTNRPLCEVVFVK